MKSEAALYEIGVMAMTAQSDPHASAAVYRQALIDICNFALKAQAPPRADALEAPRTATAQAWSANDEQRAVWAFMQADDEYGGCQADGSLLGPKYPDQRVPFWCFWNTPTRLCRFCADFKDQYLWNLRQSFVPRAAALDAAREEQWRTLIERWRKRAGLPSHAGWADSAKQCADDLEKALAADGGAVSPHEKKDAETKTD